MPKSRNSKTGGGTATTPSSVDLAESTTSVGGGGPYKTGGCNPCACWALKDACIVVGIWTVLYGIINLALFGWQTSIVKLEKEFAASQRALWYGTLRREDPRYPASFEQFYQTPEERFLLGLYVVQIVHLISDIFLIGAGLAIIFATNKESRFLLWPYFPAVIISMASSAAFVAVWLMIPPKPSNASSLSSLKSVRERIPYWPVMVAFQFLMFVVNIYCFVVIIAGYRHISNDALKDAGYFLDWKPKKSKSNKPRRSSATAGDNNNNNNATAANQQYNNGAKVNESFMTTNSPSNNFMMFDNLHSKDAQMGDPPPSFNFSASPTRLRHPLDSNIFLQQQSGVNIPPDPYQSNPGGGEAPMFYTRDIPPPYHAPYVGGEKSTFTNHWLDTIEQPVIQQQPYVPPPAPVIAPNLADFIPPPPTHSIGQSSYQRRQKQHRRSKRRNSSKHRRRRPPDSTYFDDDNYDYDSADENENEDRTVTGYDSRSGATRTTYDNRTFQSSGGSRRSSGRNRRRRPQGDDRSSQRRRRRRQDRSTSSTDESSMYSTSDYSDTNRTEEGKTYRSRSTRDVRNSAAETDRGFPKSRSAYFPSSGEDDDDVRRGGGRAAAPGSREEEIENSTVDSSSCAAGFKRSRSDDGRLSDHRRSSRCRKHGSRHTRHRHNQSQQQQESSGNGKIDHSQRDFNPQSHPPASSTPGAGVDTQPPTTQPTTGGGNPTQFASNPTATAGGTGGFFQPVSTNPGAAGYHQPPFSQATGQPVHSTNPFANTTTITIPHHIIIPFPSASSSSGGQPPPPAAVGNPTNTNSNGANPGVIHQSRDPMNNVHPQSDGTGGAPTSTTPSHQPGGSGLVVGQPAGHNHTTTAGAAGNKYQINSEITIRIPRPPVAPKKPHFSIPPPPPTETPANVQQQPLPSSNQQPAVGVLSNQYLSGHSLDKQQVPIIHSRQPTNQNPRDHQATPTDEFGNRVSMPPVGSTYV